ncbi:MAG: LysE family translocator [Rhodobacteraceae bacterium]|jgi:threonine/homoserine/homoserine lactone efflux protein|nr:LysE family translocator [Paracoccaceae bacterium]
MELSTLLPFFFAVMAVTAAPGPLVAIVVTRTLSRDAQGALAFAAGVCMGDMIAILAIALGFGVWAQNSPEWLAMLKLAGVAWLLWLAWQIWRDSDKGAAGNASPRRGVLASVSAGAALCLGNPATFVFYLVLLPAAAPEGLGEAGVLVSILLASLLAVGASLAAMILIASRLQRVLVSRAANALFGRAMAVLLGAASVSLLLT